VISDESGDSRSPISPIDQPITQSPNHPMKSPITHHPMKSPITQSFNEITNHQSPNQK
jgi:hypothetical protein